MYPSCCTTLAGSLLRFHSEIRLPRSRRENTAPQTSSPRSASNTSPIIARTCEAIRSGTKREIAPNFPNIDQHLDLVSSQSYATCRPIRISIMVYRRNFTYASIVLIFPHGLNTLLEKVVITRIFQLSRFCDVVEISPEILNLNSYNCKARDHTVRKVPTIFKFSSHLWVSVFLLLFPVFRF